MTEKKVGRPKKQPVARPLTYNEQTRANRLLSDLFMATGREDGPSARKVLDTLTELLESAMG